MDRFRLLLGEQYTFEEDCIMEDSEAEALYDLCMTYAKRIGDTLQDMHKAIKTFPEMKHALKVICRIALCDNTIIDCVSADKSTVKKMEADLHELVTH